MSQWRDILQIYGLFIASIITLVGAIIIGAGLSPGSADARIALFLIGGVMAFIGLGIIWSALKKPKPRPQWRYPYYPQYPGYQQYYPYQQYPRYPPYYQQPQNRQQAPRASPQAGQPGQSTHPSQQPQTPHRSYPPQASRPYPSTRPTPPPSTPHPSHRPYPPPPQQPYRQPTRPPPPRDYKKPEETSQPAERHEPKISDEEFPPPPDFSQVSRDPDYEPEGVTQEGPEEVQHVPVVKEQPMQGPREVQHPVRGAPPSPPHKIRVQASPSQPPPAYGYRQQYPQAGYRQAYPYPYPSYPYYQYPYPQPYAPGYAVPQKEAKLELPNILTLFVIFIGAIFIGALGLYTGGVLILFFPFAFIIAFSFPSFMWISYVYKKDVHEPEPRRVVMIALTFGFLSTILAIALSIPFVLLSSGIFVSAVIVAPVVEEFSKASGLRLTRSEIDSELDGVIYGVTIGMGFAMVENFLYELGFIFTDPAVWTFGSLLRGLGSTIGHGLGAGFIGYAYASYHLNRDRPGAFNKVILAYLAAVGLHALWNGVAVLSGENALGLVVIVLIAVAEVVILKTLVSIARDKDLKRMTEGPAKEPPAEGR